MSDTDATFNFLISMVYTQLFNLLCEKADFVEKKYFKDIAYEEKRNYDAVKKRIRTLSQDLKEEIIEYLAMNYRREE